MTDYIPEIDLVSIDLDSIASDDENSETIVFDIVLSAHPTSKWIEEFEILYQRTPFTIKPPVTVEGDRLRVHFLPRYQRDLQRFVDFLTATVQLTTAEARRTELIKRDSSKEERKEEFRNVLAEVRLLSSASRS
jgi:hypothetical protein